MRPPRALLISLIIVCVTISVVGAEPAASKPSATQKAKPGMAVSAAVAALVKEYQAYAKDPKLADPAAAIAAPGAASKPNN